MLMRSTKNGISGLKTWPLHISSFSQHTPQTVRHDPTFLAPSPSTSLVVSMDDLNALDDPAATKIHIGMLIKVMAGIVNDEAKFRTTGGLAVQSPDYDVRRRWIESGVARVREVVANHPDLRTQCVNDFYNELCKQSVLHAAPDGWELVHALLLGPPVAMQL